MSTSHASPLTVPYLREAKQSFSTRRNIAPSDDRVTPHPFHRADLAASRWTGHPVEEGEPGRRGNYRSDWVKSLSQ